MKDFWKRKRNKRIAASALAVVMAGFLVWGLFPWQAAAAGTTVADDVTINNWQDTLDNSTKNVGRIWTDKSVSTEDVTLTNKSGDTKTIKKGQKSYDDKTNSDFLVGLSALSSTAELLGQTSVPLDIVLVLDVSGSMKNDKKMETLKTAVNSFIGATADKNDALSDKNKQSRISLVKFAGDKTDTVGNDTYEEGFIIKDTYNYTQIVSRYEAYTSANKKALQDKVNALEPAGATSADYAMQLAKQLVSPKTPSNNDALNPRENAKKIVIFFTDGEPNHQNGFNDDVANAAIDAAKEIKAKADIYTIGVFNNANASDTTGRFNAYMHGMSSNYPNATTYKNLGERAKDSDGKPTQFYKAATDASDLNNIFNEIEKEIVSSAQYPTHVEGESPNQGGYITFTDQLGDYMQVDDMNALVYANTIHAYKKKQESLDKSTITYIYEEQIVDPNHVDPEGNRNLKDIKITVKKSDNLKTGDLVTVMIPANMIPLRYYEVSKGTMTISEAYPMRLFYDVSLKAGAEKKIENPDAAMQAYIATNTNDKGQVQFYSNKYEAGENDKPETIGAYSHFVPATTNDFYYFQEDAPLYTNENCTVPAASIDRSVNTTYYYQRNYYKLEDGKAEKKTNTVTIPGNSDILQEKYAEKKDGQYYIRAGAPRTTSLSYFTENKSANETGTASTFIKPTWDYSTDGSGVTTYLGNNGKMTFDLPGELDITKTVKKAEGHEVPESLKNKEFEYKLELTAKEGSQLKEKYTAQKYTEAEAEGIDIKSGDTFTLKDGQTLKIYGLESGTTYTVTETKATHFAGTAAQTNAGDNAVVNTDKNGNVTATGAITGNEKTFVNYTNTYEADPVKLNGSENLKVEKDFQLADGTSAWNMEYLEDSQFTFLLTASSNTPMPNGYTESDGIKTAEVTVSDKNNITKAFGDITFTEPGTYEYQIIEKDPGENRKPGVSYSNEVYTVTVTVTDDNGTLKAAAKMKKTHDDNGTKLATATVAADKIATFKNVYDTNSESVSVKATKVFVDHTGSKTLKDGDYKFKITAINGAPLSNGKSSIVAENVGNEVTFTSKTFTIADAQGATATKPKIYEYTLEEVLPEEATAENEYKVEGITYDPTQYTIELKVYVKNVAGKDTVVVDRIYKNAADGTDLAANEVPVFHNSYSAAPVNTALKGEKILSGRDMLENETFDFTLAGDDSTKKALKDEVVTIAKNGDRASVKGGKNDKPESFKFGDVTFTKEGTYTFDIKETPGSAAGVTYDQHTTKATVVVTDDADHPGKLKASVTYDNGTVSDATDKAVFKNKYEASFEYRTTGGLNVEKVLNGRTMKAGEFEFKITPKDGAPGVSPKGEKFTNPEQRVSGEPVSMQKLQGLVFTEADAGKTYTYTVAETAGDLSGVTYDDTEYTVAIKVVDNGDGTMHTVTTITWTAADGSAQTAVYDSSSAGAGTPTVRFNNSYKAANANPVDITEGFQKVLTGRDWKDSDSFTFTLRALTNGAPMPDKSEVTVSEDDLANGKAPVSFGNIIFTKAGVYEYEVKEQDPGDGGAAGVKYDTAARIITVTVTDNEKGQLEAVVTTVADSRTFTNKYETEDLHLDEVCGVSVTKVLNGHDMAAEQFKFTIKAADKPSADKLKIATEDGATFKNPAAAADGKIATLFSGLGMTLTQSDIGKTYSYTFAETKGSDKEYTYDKNKYQLKIKTIDAGNGTLTADVTLTNIMTNEVIFNHNVSKENKFTGNAGVVIPFVNYYNGSTDVDGGTAAAISASKTMEGRKLHAGEFQFKLVTRPADGSKGTVLQSKRNRKDGTIGFDPLSYRTSEDAEGRGVILSDAVKDGYAVKSTNDKGQTVYTLSYRIYEDEEEWTLPNNVTVVNGNFNFTVTVTDDGQGHLTAVTNYPDGSNGKFGFVNQYGAEPVPVELKGSKTLDHESGLNPDSIADKFTFSLSSSTEEAPLPDSKTAKNDADGNITFGQITFKLSDLDGVEPADDGSRNKDFIYTVKETSGSAPGVTNDTGDKTFTLTLKDDGKGHLSVTKNPADGPLFTFTNTYTVSKLPSSITDQVKVTKKLTGRDLKAGEFHFELLEDGEVAARGTNDANGSVTFDKITYTAPGTHTYTVREVNNDLGGVTYDDQLYTVHTTITDNGDGALKAEHEAVAVIDGKELADEITFNNKYEAKGTTVSIGAVKRLTGKDLKDDQFTFQLKDETGKVIDEAKNDKAGAISFKALEFDKAGTYKYTISEVNDKQKEIKYDTSEKTVTITVKDSGDGYLQAQVESEKQLIFTNTFEAAGGSGTKTGDNMNLVLPIMMMLTAAAIGSVLLIRRKYHR